MKKRTFCLNGMIAGILLITATATQAQEKLRMKIGYDISTPVGSFKDQVSATSFRGLNAELMYPLSNRLQAGMGVLYNDYYQKFPRQVYDTKDGAISAVVSNSVQTVPVLAKVNYNLARQGLIKPYAGLGAGLNLITYKQYLGEFPDSKTSLKPAVSGDAGVNVALGKTKTAGLNLGANFNYMPFNYNDISTLNNWGVHAGIFFTLR